jgi:hypothetical protein
MLSNIKVNHFMFTAQGLEWELLMGLDSLFLNGNHYIPLIIKAILTEEQKNTFEAAYNNPEDIAIVNTTFQRNVDERWDAWFTLNTKCMYGEYELPMQIKCDWLDEQKDVFVANYDLVFEKVEKHYPERFEAQEKFDLEAVCADLAAGSDYKLDRMESKGWDIAKEYFSPLCAILNKKLWWQLFDLKSLDLSLENLTEIPECVFSLTQLTHLIVSHNNLTSIPDKIGNLVNLELLFADGNGRLKLPDVSKCTKLKPSHIRGFIMHVEE